MRSFNLGGLQADLNGGGLGGRQSPQEKNNYFDLPSSIGAKY
jgi:hypothetical protein